MSLPVLRTTFARNWRYFKAGYFGVLPLAIFALLLMVLFLRSIRWSGSAFFEDTTGMFNVVLYIALSVWAITMAVRNGRRLLLRRATPAPT